MKRILISAILLICMVLYFDLNKVDLFEASTIILIVFAIFLLLIIARTIINKYVVNKKYSDCPGCGSERTGEDSHYAIKYAKNKSMSKGVSFCKGCIENPSQIKEDLLVKTLRETRGWNESDISQIQNAVKVYKSGDKSVIM